MDLEEGQLDEDLEPIPCFIEITRRNVFQYADLIRTSLKESTVVGLALHSTVPPDSAKWTPGESLQEHYVRLTKLALQHQVYGVGLSCAKLIPNEDATRPSTFSVCNFNLTVGTSSPSLTNIECLQRLRELGYDLNYVVQEGASYYRGRNDILHQSEESHLLRDLFLDVHGDGSHPVIVQHGFLDIVMAYTAFAGLPGDKAEEFLERMFCLFPGKICDVAAFPSNNLKKSIVSTSVMEGVEAKDIFIISDDAGKGSGPNISHPAVLDSFRNLTSFLQNCVIGLKQMDSFGNRLVPVDAPTHVLLQSNPDSIVRTRKKKKAEYDFTIPLTAVVTDKEVVEEKDHELD